MTTPSFTIFPPSRQTVCKVHSQQSCTNYLFSSVDIFLYKLVMDTSDKGVAMTDGAIGGMDVRKMKDAQEIIAILIVNAGRIGCTKK